MNQDDVLIIVAHPDDEVIGAGGTILRLVQDYGYKAHVLVMSDLHEAMPNHVDSLTKQNWLSDAAEKMGVTWIQKGFPAQKLDTIPFKNLVGGIEVELKKLDEVGFKPGIVFTHSVADLNLDHQLVAKAALTALRPKPESSVTALYSFEIPSSTDWSFNQIGGGFAPNVFVDITKWWEQKEALLSVYDGEILPAPHPRSYENIKNVAKVRGATVGVSYAEAFQLVWSKIC